MPIASAFRSVLHVFGAAVIALLSPALLAQSSVSTAADGFDPNFDGHVYALAMQPDGKMVIGGSFTMMQPNSSLAAHATTNIARLQRDGTYDDSWSCTVNGQINAIVRQPNGQFIIGGKFTEVDGVARNRIARINADGSLDQTFDPNIEPDAYTPANDASLTPDVMGLALQPDGAVLVVGGFKYVKPNGGERTKRYRVARFKSDGSLDATFDPSANNMVLAVAVQTDGQILIGGGFTKLNGGAVEIARLARLSANGAVDTAFAPTPDNAVATIVPLSGGKVLIGGSFTSFLPNGTDTAVSTHQRISRLNADGTLDTTFTGYADAPVNTIRLQSDGLILVGGLFSAIGNSSRSYVARLLPNGLVDTTFWAGPNYAVYAIGEQADGGLIIAGGFNAVSGGGKTSTLRGHVARVLPSGALDADFRPDVNGRLRTIAMLSNGQILAAGTFTSIAGQTRNGLVRLNADGSVDPSFNASVNAVVLAVAEQADGRILIGGSFTQVSGVTRPYFARLEKDGKLDALFNCATNGPVNAIRVQSDGKIVLVGSFTTIAPLGTTEPVSRSYIARLNTDQTLDLAFNPVLSAAASALVIQGDGKIIVGGGFSSVLGSDAKAVYTRYGMVRLNTDGNIDVGFNPNVNGSVYAIALQSDGKVVFGGMFQQMAPNGSTTALERGNVARLNADGTADTTFDPHVNDTVATLAVQSDGKIVIGGLFTSLSPNGGGAVSRNYVVRVNADGTLDPAFDLELDRAPGNSVTGLGLTSSGKIVIGGGFTRLTAHGQTVARNRIAMLNADGSIDTSFNSELSSAAGPAIEALITQPNGMVIAAGSFSGINGTTSSNLAAFSADGAPSTTFSPTMDGSVHAIALRPTSGAPVTTQSTGFAWLQRSGELNANFKLGDNVSFTAIRAIAFDNQGRILLAGDMKIDGVTGVFARFKPDGTVDSTFDFKPSGTVYSIVVQSDDKIIIGGSFTTFGDVTRNNIARINADGSLDTTFDPEFNSAVYAVALQSDGKIVVGGNFTTAQPNSATTTTARSYIARLNSDGTLDTGFNPTPDYTVQTIVVQGDGKIVVGGSFSSFKPNGATTATTRSFFARINSDGTLDDTVSLDLNSTVASIQQQTDGKLVIGGYFSSVGGVTRNYVARVNTDGTVDSSFNPNPNGAVTTIAIQTDGKVMITGNFTAIEPGNTTYNSATATPRSYAARLNPDGSLDNTFNPNFDAVITRNVVAPDGSLVFAGSFSSIQPSGQLVAGGLFSTINGVPIANLALFSSDGSTSATFQPNPNGAVYALVPVIDERLVVAGAFTSIAGATRNHIARFTSDNQLDTAFNPNIDGEVYAVTVQPDGKLIVGGKFAKVGSLARSNLVRLNDDGTVDASFVGSATGEVHVLVLQPDGRVLVTQTNASGDRVLGRLNADGSSDSSFNPAHDGSVLAVALQTDGHIVVSGTFTTIGGGTRSRLARLDATGALDGTVNATPNGPVTAIEVQPDGKLLLGGSFTAVDDLPRFGLARLAAPVRAMRTFTLSEDRNTVTWVRAGGSPEVTAVVFETSTDASTWTTLGYGQRVGTSPSWRYTGLNAGTATGIYVRARGIVPASPHSSSGLADAQQWLDLTAKPMITSATVLNGAAGADFYYATTATNQPTSFSVAGLPAGLSFDTTTGVLSGKPTQAGTYLVTITATNANGSSSTTITLIVASGTEDPGRMINLSINGHVTADNPIIAGFVIKGTSAQNVLLRAVGPGLQSVSTITNPLAAPHLRLFDRNGQLLSETASWGGGDTLRSTFTRLGAFPLADNSTDAAILVTLMPGAYTMHVIDSGAQGGRALAEVYDASANPPPVNAPRLINLSARGVVSPGESVTGGFVIRGTSSKRILIRGVGPTLASQGVPSVLVNPVVTLYRSSAAIARNDDWQTPVTTDASYPAASGADLSAAATSTGAFALPAGSKDAAILLTLAPGIYTAEVTSADGSTGAALVEAYEVP